MTRRFIVTGVLIVAASMMPRGTTTGAQGSAGGNTDWSLHNGDLGNGRYAPLDEINVSNVGRMALKWSFEVGAAETIRQVTPVVLDGVIPGSRMIRGDRRSLPGAQNAQLCRSARSVAVTGPAAPDLSSI